MSLGDFKQFILQLDKNAIFRRGSCALSTDCDDAVIAQEALNAGAEAQSEDWMPCTAKQAEEDFGDADLAGWYLEGDFDDGTVEFVIHKRTIYFV